MRHLQLQPSSYDEKRRKEKKGAGSLFLAFKQEQTNRHPCRRSYFDPE
jgi:hypothetical protein